MSAPRLEIDLTKIGHNAGTLVDLLAGPGISVTGVTKATLGSPEIARVLVGAGVHGLGDSRIENIEAMRAAGITAPMTLIRSPMISQLERVVAHADVSLNTELDVVSGLSSAAQRQGRIHGVVLMVELGDLREGVMPEDLPNLVQETMQLPNIELRGLGTNLACQSGVSPDDDNMADLSALAQAIEITFDVTLDVVSGGNSANLPWVLSGADTGRVNDLRLGEAILLGREPLHRRPITGLHIDAITLVAEVIEAKIKPSRPTGAIAQTAFGETSAVPDRGDLHQAILAVGHQDVDPTDVCAPVGVEILGASSDHLIVTTRAAHPAVGSEIRFQLGYRALMRSMTSPFVEKQYLDQARAST